MKNLTLEKIVRFAIGAAALSIVALIMYNYITLVAYLILAMILSYILDPIVNRMQRAGLNRTFAITLTLSALILLIVYISTNVIPIFGNEMLELTENLTVEKIEEITSQIEDKIRNDYPFVPSGALDENVTRITEELFDLGKLSNVVGDVVGIFTNIF